MSGEFNRGGFIVTNLELPSRAGVGFYAELSNEPRSHPTAAMSI